MCAVRASARIWAQSAKPSVPESSDSITINDGSGRGLGSRLGGARVLAADGKVRTLPDDFDPNRLRAMLTANGGEPIDE